MREFRNSIPPSRAAQSVAALLLLLLGPACTPSPTDPLPPPVGPSSADVAQLTVAPNPAVVGEIVTVSFRPIRHGGTTSLVGWDADLSESGFVRNMGSLTGPTSGVVSSGSLVTLAYQTVAPTSAAIHVEAWPDQCIELTVCSFCCGSARSVFVEVVLRR
jgi:hypothetical protein